MYGIEALLAGRTLGGRYLVEEVIGRGGMGAVYRARDERLGRAVAVKVIAVAAADDEEHGRLRARFHREARAAAGLGHPNVVAVFDYGTDADLGLDYLVMELLRGEDLAGRLHRVGPPPRPVALSILRQAARGLAAGHRAGIVHRDIKPGNLFLCDGGEGGEGPHVEVLDFGIAQAAGDDGALTKLTQVGRAPLSPAYASPEQLMGMDTLTPASDVFSLGAVGYHLLTGYRCFTSAEPRTMAGELGESLRALDDRAPGLDPAVRDALLRALTIRPTGRFAHAGAFADALAAVGAPTAFPSAADAPAPWDGRDREDTATGDRTQLFTGPSPRPDPRATPPGGADHTEFFPGELPPRPAPRAQTRAPEPAPEWAAYAPAPPPPAPAHPSTGRAVSVEPDPEPLPPAPVHEAEPEPARPPRQRGGLRSFARAMWDVTVSLVVTGLFVGSWGLAVHGLMQDERELMLAAGAATVLFTPMAVHRLTGRRGRLRWQLLASLLGTGAALYLAHRSEADPMVALAGMFGLQVVGSWAFATLTRRRGRVPREG